MHEAHMNKRMSFIDIFILVFLFAVIGFSTYTFFINIGVITGYNIEDSTGTRNVGVFEQKSDGTTVIVLGATVIVQGNSNNYTGFFEDVTYWFRDILVGNYILQINAPGYAPFTDPNFEILAGSNTGLAAFLTPSSVGGGSFAPSSSETSAYWSFNEADWNSGSASVLDNLGSSSATPMGGVNTVSQGVGGRAGYFDGSDDFVENSAYTITSGGPVTIMFWMRVNTSEVKNAGIFGVGDGSATNRMNVYLWGDKKLHWDYGEPSLSKGRISFDYSPYYGNWTHVALVSGGNGGTIKSIYLNGQLVASSTSSDGPDSSLNGISIGAGKDQGTFAYFKGLIDDVNLTYRVTSANEIKSIYDMQRRELASAGSIGNVAYWGFEGGLSSDAGAIKDTIIGLGATAKNGVASISGRVGAAASFDGVDDEIIVSNPIPLSFRRPFTVTGWFRTNNLITGDITASWVSKRNAYVFGPNKDGSVSLWAFLDDSWVEARTPIGSVREGTWQYWTGSYNGTHLIISLNGSEVKNISALGILSTSGDLYIGHDFTGGPEKRFFNGSIDELQFYDRGLLTVEVDSLFKSQLALAETTPVPPTTINACGAIDRPGIYNLVQSVSSSTTCFIIRADNVFLDGQGNSVRVAVTSDDPLVEPTPTIGIKILDKANVTLKNIKIEGFTTGAILHRAKNALLDHVFISQSGELGLHINDTRDAKIVEGAVEQSLNAGIWFERSNNNSAERLAVRSNAGYGIFFASSSDNLLSRITFSNNGLGDYANDSMSMNNNFTLTGSSDTQTPTTPSVIQPTQLARGHNVVLSIGQPILFRVGTVTYNLTAVTLSSGKLTAVIRGGQPITIALTLNGTQLVDLNSNNLPDFNITFLNVTNGKPVLLLRTITEPTTPTGGRGSTNPDSGNFPGGGTSPGSGVTTLTNITNSSNLGDRSGGVQWDTRTIIIVIVALIIFIIFVIVAIVYTVKQQNTNKNGEFYKPEPHSSTLQPGGVPSSGF